MCGIAGIYQLDSQPADSQLAERMIGLVRHRGPDAAGVVVDARTALAHARLSILDIQGGRQPMPNADRSLWITYNGEVFNYIELRETLEAKGHRFTTRSDTEVVLHAYEQFGEACVDHFNGQWAFAIWDARRDRLFLSRDRFGIRPLFYTVSGGKFLFASEVKSLFADSTVARRIDPRGLDQLFTTWSTIPPTTVFEGLFELPPGHNLVVSGRQIRTKRYWQLRFDPNPEPLCEAECAERLFELLADATRIRLRSDVPVGAYLSGGLDSSITAALLRQSTGAELRTFSVTFDDAEFDESAYQREVVEALGTDHQAIRCSRDAIAHAFANTIWHTERPLVRTAPAPLYLLSEQVRSEGYKVVVTGEGADEMLGGYDLFKEAKVRRFWAAQPNSDFRAGLLGRLYPYLPPMMGQSLAYRKAFFRVGPGDLANPFFSHLPRWELTSRLKSFFSPEFGSLAAGYDVYEELESLLPEGFTRWHPFSQAQYLEITTLLPGYILSSQGDRMAMAHCVEGRFPFLDHRVAELAATFPPRVKMKGLREKHVLKRAAGHLVPPSVANRPKQPYRAPEASSFFHDDGSARQDFVDELLASDRIRRDGVFEPKAVALLVEKARSRRAIGVKDNMALVAVLSTQLLLEQFGSGFPLRSRRADTADDRIVRTSTQRAAGNSPQADLIHCSCPANQE